MYENYWKFNQYREKYNWKFSSIFENENALLKQEVEELKVKVRFYEEQFRLSQAKKYGSSSEKIDPEQILVKRKKDQSKSRKTYKDLEIEEVYYTISRRNGFAHLVIVLFMKWELKLEKSLK